MNDRRGRIFGATLATTLVVALSACTSNPSATLPPSIAATPAPTVVAATPTALPTVVPPTAEVTAPPTTEAAGADACAASDLKASHGRVEGAAGSRFTTVVLSPAIACSVDLFPAFGLRDANGTPVVGAASAGPGRIDLDPDITYQSNVQVGNWCAEDTAFPLTFELHIGGTDVEVTGGPFPEPDDLPPCNGDTQAPVLAGTSWEAVP